MAQFVQLLKPWLWDMRPGPAVKNGAHSADQCWLQVQFSAHLINLLSILLKGNGFARTEKAVVDQTSSRPPNSDRDFFLVQAGLWEML